MIKLHHKYIVLISYGKNDDISANQNGQNRISPESDTKKQN